MKIHYVMAVAAVFASAMLADQPAQAREPSWGLGFGSYNNVEPIDFSPVFDRTLGGLAPAEIKEFYVTADGVTYDLETNSVERSSLDPESSLKQQVDLSITRISLDRAQLGDSDTYISGSVLAASVGGNVVYQFSLLKKLHVGLGLGLGISYLDYNEVKTDNTESPGRPFDLKTGSEAAFPGKTIARLSVDITDSVGVELSHSFVKFFASDVLTAKKYSVSRLGLYFPL